MAEEIVVDTTKNVEQKETVKTQAEVTSAGSEQTDYEKLIADQNAKIAKLEENNSNLTKGISKWKKAAKSDDDYAPEPLEDDRLEELIDKKVNQKLAESQLAQAVSERDNMLSNMARELREAKLALKNHPNSPTGSGISDNKPEVKTGFFTKEQLDELKAKGLDPAKVEENYRKIREEK